MVSKPTRRIALEGNIKKLNQNFLAFDLGAKTGYAYTCYDRIVSGVIDVGKMEKQTSRTRYKHFYDHIDKLIMDADHVFYEGVAFSKYVYATQAYGAYKALLTMRCEEHNVPLTSIAVPMVKNIFVHKKNANKDEMVAQCKKMGFKPVDDNESDAIATLYAAVHNTINGL